MLNAPVANRPTIDDDKSDLWVSKRKGIVALSPRRNWEYTQNRIIIAEHPNRLTTTGLFQAYFEPPHCNARRTQTMAGMKNIGPT
jgi:hypothetical protein